MIRCHKCNRAFWKLGCGFAGKDELYCSRDDIKVSKQDGCTLGNPGEPMRAVIQDIEIDIKDHEAVWGDEKENDGCYRRSKY